MKLMSTEGARRLHKGDVIVLAGSPPQRGLCFILSGGVQIVHRMGERALKIGRLGAGQFFGEYSLVLERSTDFDAIATEADTVVLYIDPLRFFREIRHNPQYLRELLSTAMQRLGFIMQTLVSLGMPFKIEVPPDLARIIAENRERNLKILELVNNTRSAFITRDRQVFHEHQVNDGNFYLVTEGCITANTTVAGFDGPILRFVPGDMFGFARANIQPTRPYAAVAAQDSRIMTFDQDYLLRVLQLNTECFWSVFRTAVTQVILLDTTLHQAVDAAMAPGSPEKAQALAKAMLEV